MMTQNQKTLIEALGFQWKALSETAENHLSGRETFVDFPMLESARLFFAAGLASSLRKKIVYVLPSKSRIDELKRECAAFLKMWGVGGIPVSVLPPIAASPFDPLSVHAHIQASRAEAVSHLYSPQQSMLLLPAESLAWGIPKEENFRGRSISISKGDSIEVEKLAADLVSGGYQRRQIVQEPGDFAVRGFVVDIFSPDRGFPARIELFGDTVESLRLFNPSDQKSLSEEGSYAAVPLRGMLADEELVARTRGYVVGNSSLTSEERAEMLEQLAEGEDAPWFWNVKNSDSCISSLGSALAGTNACFVISEPEACQQSLETIFHHWDQQKLTSNAPFGGWARKARNMGASLLECGDCNKIVLGSIQEAESVVESGVLSVPLVSAAKNSPQSAMEIIRNKIDDAKTALALLNSKGHMERLGDAFHEMDVKTLSLTDVEELGNRYEEIAGAARHGVAISLIAELSDSFECSDSGLSFYSHEFIFGKARKTPSKRAVSKTFSLPIEELKDGDFIVHEDHGIGIFTGLRNVQRGEERQEFIQIEYSGGDRLLIPIEKMGKVQRYSSMEGARPRLDKLGGATWRRVKRRVQKALREMAGELVNLYAIRKTIKGFAFQPDNEMMREFEESFPHLETPDQQSSMEEIKADMESSKPMDRLLCGDVGYGKTELAMRAAVKAVISGKQVAVLAPTTILAQQHFETFSRRMSGFPFTVDVISRFRSGAEQKELLKRLREGETNILIGTHRLLSKDVVFKDLGLLIVDEEQRFGVAHKEKMKKLRKKVDVLSMTATPIPRTLHMSLSGIREMSLIQTPPRNRMAIQTRVLPFREEIIRSAVEQELEREGQVFYLRNRVEGIEEAAARIKRICPGARPVIAHAQMSADKLEAVMNDFVEGRYNVLVSTTIIENGIDIPNANTLIVEHAERFGLSQLYQIRGRVGRSERLAYAYLLVPSTAGLSDDARRRLRAIREFSDLGSGFRIAAMDLEIRGAGTMLGGEQSGHIEAVGFDLYNRMLERTVNELRGHGTDSEFETRFQLHIDTHIPAEYIEAAATRMKYYQRCMEAGTDLEIENIRDELRELFGPIPESVRTLLTFATVKSIASRLRINRIERASTRFAFWFTPESQINAQALAELLDERKAVFTEKGVLQLELDTKDHGELLSKVERILRSLE